MGLEFDKLVNNEVFVVYNNTTGAVFEFYDLEDFKIKLFDECRISEDKIKEYFNKAEIEEFFEENDIEFFQDALDILFE